MQFRKGDKVFALTPGYYYLTPEGRLPELSCNGSSQLLGFLPWKHA